MLGLGLRQELGLGQAQKLRFGGWGGAGGLGHELRGSLTCLYRKLELCYKHEH